MNFDFVHLASNCLLNKNNFMAIQSKYYIYEIISKTIDCDGGAV